MQGKRGDDEKEPNTKLPNALTVKPVGVNELIILERKAAPPKRFTESTLLHAMNHIHLYVEAPEVRNILKETSGIGTAAHPGEDHLDASAAAVHRQRQKGAHLDAERAQAHRGDRRHAAQTRYDGTL